MSQLNLSPEQILELKSYIEGAELSLQQAKKMLGMATGETNGALARKASAHGGFGESDEGQVIEGVFDGQHMIGPDGKQYSIPANYASKSKLVEGDLMKLTIGPSGHFMYKQIGPIERTRLIGVLTREEESNEWRVVAEGRSYKVILASVTYFKGEEGDEVTIMVPKDKSSNWAAVENIIKNTQGEGDGTPVRSTSSQGGFTPVVDAPTIKSDSERQAESQTPSSEDVSIPELASSAGSSNDQLYVKPQEVPADTPSPSPSPSAIPSTFTPTDRGDNNSQNPEQITKLASEKTTESVASPSGNASYAEPEQEVQQGGNYGKLTFDDDEFDKI